MVGIYKITNKINGKSYIGQSRNIKRRINDHKKTAFNVKSKNFDFPLYKAIRKYGLENFEFNIITECKESELDKLEVFYIKEYNSYNNGYNQNKGGNGAGHYNKLTDELVDKIILKLKTSLDNSDAIGMEFGVTGRTVRSINLGETCLRDDENYPIRPPLNTRTENRVLKPYIQGFNGPEVDIKPYLCEKCGAPITLGSKLCVKCAHLVQQKAERPEPLELARLVKEKGFMETGRIFNVDGNTIKKWCRGYDIPYHKNELIAWYNLQMNVAEPIKKRQATTGGKRQVSQINPDTDEIIATFDSIKEAGKSLGLQRWSQIGEVCNGKGNTAYGFKWKFVDSSTLTDNSFLDEYHEKMNIQPPEKNQKIDKRKAVYQLDPDTFEIINTFESTNVAARAFGRKKGSAVCEVCNGHRKLAYGFKWCYADEHTLSAQPSSLPTAI